MKIIVIGSGIVGSSTAYHLAKKGAEVFLVDRLHDGQATAAGAGIVCPWISSVNNKDWYTLANAGACYYPKLVSQLKEDGESNIGYGLVGALAVSNDDEELNVIEQTARTRQLETPEVGEVRRLSGREARELFPPLNEDLKAVYVSGAARVDGRLLRDALKRGAEKHGAQLYTGLASLEIVNEKVTGVHVNGEVLSADAVVLTAGAWISELLEPYGIGLQVEPQRGQIVHLKLPDQDTSNWPVILPQSSHYLVSFEDSRIVVGATRESGSGFDYRVTAAGVKEVIEEALFVAPGLSNSTLHEVRVGFRPISADILPLLGHIPAVNGLIIANGLGASGLTMGPFVGNLAAKLALNEKLESDITPYHPLRHTKNVKHC
ncbi:NAD(P)/FAD-dependent oxidoreductase [Heyndrickxia oleronia]|jgi:D-amino-acid dehydrogenase|uniref:NAD(P)/FAD-dependent oxidoreductase n=1 Tax=Heyndrickxia oleronia TaxID=38875 RepID=UPI00242FB545|nr:FAD-dependent oxidoreductase [Heyndrickxia oleronia]MCI1588996.1 FAD-binding oxidoreductase [Heyndrickxia oleronia]MCI1611912.1 FAD-binding oxidoreductase [Heyndrickxia oleronia]MCI1743081.1 FAD-binding oxidoreductase [Heyndrickxia oleronia]MCI1759575.1 FAD-binding oxidoreductase [Heyndrickxia oleronia]